jgi:hypothetical protein
MTAPLIDLYRGFLEQTGEPTAAAILAIGAASQPAPSVARTVLTPPLAAKQIGCAPETIIGWIRSGALKASNLAKGQRPRYVIDPDDLSAFLTTRQEKPPAARVQQSRPSVKNYRAWRAANPELSVKKNAA